MITCICEQNMIKINGFRKNLTRSTRTACSWFLVTPYILAAICEESLASDTYSVLRVVRRIQKACYNNQVQKYNRC